MRSVSIRWSIQPFVRMGNRVFDRFQMRGDMGVGNGLADVGFDAFRPVVTLLHGPGAGHQHVQRDESAGAGLARAQGVEVQPLLAVDGQHGFAVRDDLGPQQGGVHQQGGTGQFRIVNSGTVTVFLGFGPTAAEAAANAVAPVAGTPSNAMALLPGAIEVEVGGV